MSPAAQTLRAITTSLATCLVIFALAGKIGAQEEPKKAAGSTVRGTVTYSDTGRPLRNAKVAVYNNEPVASEIHGITDWRGKFVIEGIPAGRYILVVDAPGILTPPDGIRTSSRPKIPQLSLSGERGLFTELVVNGTDSVDDVKIQAVRGGVITGRVVTDDDQPLAKAEIRLLSRENGKWLPVKFAWDVFRMHRKDLFTDPNGVYRIAGLPAGDYLVRVSEPSLQTDKTSLPDDVYKSGSLMMTYYPSAISVEEAQPVTVVEGSESTGIDIRLPELTPYAVSGRIVGPKNQPGVEARIRIERRDELGYIDSEYEIATYSGIDGSWRVPGVPAGDYVITIFGPIKDGPTPEAYLLAVAPKRLNIRVAAGDVVVPDIKLGWGATVSGTMTLDGKPFKASEQYFPRLLWAGAAAFGTRSILDPMSSADRYSYMGSTKVDDDGSFSVTSLSAGKYRFGMSSMTAKKFYVKSVTRKGVDLTHDAIRLKDDTVLKDVVVALASDFASIEGELTLSEGQSNRSLRDAFVVLAPANDATKRIEPELHTAQATVAGKFNFTCAPGEYFVIALTAAQLKNLPRITDEFFKNDNKKFMRIKVRSAEQLKDLKIPIEAN